jgi:hypothetical protein
MTAKRVHPEGTEICSQRARRTRKIGSVFSVLGYSP